jgi:hypothetical protein
MGFTKLFENILESSVWMAPDDFFRAWIALLAKCGPDGIARISATWISEKCHVSIDRAREILDEMQQPDPDSRSTNDDGRRIERIDGGYLLLNYQKYREMRDDSQRREYMRNYIKEYRDEGKDKARPVNSGKQRVNSGKPRLAQAEAEAEAEADKRQSVKQAFDLFWLRTPRKVGKKEAWKVWQRLWKQPDHPSLETILTALNNQKSCEQWRKGVIPNPSTWLTQGRWDDEINVSTPTSPQPKTYHCPKCGKENLKSSIWETGCSLCLKSQWKQ